MKSVKLTVLLMIAVFAACAQPDFNYVQQMAWKDYGIFHQANIGKGKLARTHSSAYLEIGDSAYSRKGLLLPRGKRDSIANPTKGLLIFDVTDNKIYTYNGTSWNAAGTGGGSSGTGTGGRLALWSSNSTLGSSIIRDDGNNVGIGIAAHSGVYKLLVNGHGYFMGNVVVQNLAHSGADYKVMADMNGTLRAIPDTGTSGSSGPTYNYYTQSFAGTTTNAFTLSQPPVAGSVVVYVNGQRLPAEYFTITVNTVQVNAGLLSFSTDTLDKIEISFKSTQ